MVQEAQAVAPLQGWILFRSKPRALPWAGLFRTVGAAEASTHSKCMTGFRDGRFLGRGGMVPCLMRTPIPPRPMPAAGQCRVVFLKTRA